LRNDLGLIGLIAVLTTVGLLAQAADLTPDDRAISAAIAAGRKLAVSHPGYPLRGHIAWEVPDSRNIDPSLGDVDAILIATPLERATHAGFEAAQRGARVNAAEVRKTGEVQAGWLTVILLTHGPNRKDESHVERFSEGKLVFAEQTLMSVATEHSEASETTYPLAAENRQRQVATISFHFDLSDRPTLQSAEGRLQFSDDQGRSFDIPINLGAYR
jgi:hypothetical protein